MSAEFGRLVDERATTLGLKDYQLQTAIGLLPGNKVFSAKQIGRLRRGDYRLVPREVVERLIRILTLPPEEAWHAAGLWPAGLDLDGYRRYRQEALAGANMGQSALKHWLGPDQARISYPAPLIMFPAHRRPAPARVAA